MSALAGSRGSSSWGEGESRRGGRGGQVFRFISEGRQSLVSIFGEQSLAVFFDATPWGLFLFTGSPISCCEAFRADKKAVVTLGRLIDALGSDPDRVCRVLISIKPEESWHVKPDVKLDFH